MTVSSDHLGMCHSHIHNENRQEITWRRLQMGTFTNLELYSRIYPGEYSELCPWCLDRRADINHMIWAGLDDPSPQGRAILNINDWEAALLSSD